MIKGLSVFLAACATVFAGQASATVIFSNDFSTSSAGFSGYTDIVTSPSGEKFLGILTQGATSYLKFNTHNISQLTLEFDLYGLLSLDGDTVINFENYNVGPDYFDLSVLGGATLLHRTYSNFPGEGAPYDGADARGTLGYQYIPGYNGAATDAIYHLKFTFAPTGDETVLQFTGLSNQGPHDEGFGIDNVKIVASAVPEPGAWQMMLAGFAALALFVRRSTSKPARSASI